MLGEGAIDYIPQAQQVAVVERKVCGIEWTPRNVVVDLERGNQQSSLGSVAWIRSEHRAQIIEDSRVVKDPVRTP